MFINPRSAWLVAACFSICAACSADDEDPCPTGGLGTVAVTYTGLPAGLDGPLTLSGGAADRTLGAAETLTGVASGTWTATPGRVTAPDTRIRTVYTDVPQTFCVRAGETTAVDVGWAAVPTSHHLWASNGTGGVGDLLGFVSEDLAASGSVDPVDVRGAGGVDLAFDREGGLWGLGGTTSDAMLVHHDAYALSGTATPDIEIDIAGIECFPRLNALAIAPNGDLWASSPCAPGVVRVLADELLRSGLATPGVTLSGTLAPAGLAFDDAGNLWVSYEGGVVQRFDARTLSASTSTPSRTLTIKVDSDPLDTSVIAVSDLAFDASGSLWGSDFGGNSFVRIAAADLAGSGAADVVPAVRVAVPLRALLEGMAFDEAGGLWTTYGSGQLARLGPTQLTTSSVAGSPTAPATIIEATDIGYLGGLALYPAPAGLPLFHSLP